MDYYIIQSLRHLRSFSLSSRSSILTTHFMSHPHTSSDGSPTVPRTPSPGLPTQTHHSSILVPTPALVESVAGGAHYSGSKVEQEGLKRRYSSHERRMSHGDVKADHKRVMEDLKELYCCRPTREIFDRTWSQDAVFEVRYPIFFEIRQQI